MRERNYRTKKNDGFPKICKLAEKPSRYKVVGFSNNELLRNKDALWYFQKAAARGHFLDL